MQSHKIERARRIFGEADGNLVCRFIRCHKDNPLVYRMFKTYAEEAVGAGLKVISPWMIINRMRWHCCVETSGFKFSISNDFIALYARLLAMHAPAFEFYFNLRPMKKRSPVKRKR